MGMTKSVFGKTSNGEVVHLVTVSNQKGMSIEVLDYGATLVSVNVPDKDGHTEDVALGYDDVLDYEKGDAYLGATVGRCGNRVDHAEFSINGKEYFMVKNSWGKSGKYDGIWYASKAFVAYKTMNILVHKDALPKEIAKKLGIK